MRRPRRDLAGILAGIAARQAEHANDDKMRFYAEGTVLGAWSALMRIASPREQVGLDAVWDRWQAFVRDAGRAA